MLKSTLFILCIVSSAVAFGQHAELSFDKKVHKFDTVREGEQLEHTFTFTNKGDAPLILSNYKVECTCTKAEFEKRPFAPGESGTVKVTFDTTGKIGWQYRAVQLFSNAKKNPSEVEIRVKVKGGE